MIRFILRRVLQMIPTFFGVIVITFVLFNVVGGSPALTKLGRNTDPKTLEEFDEQRGFNKPLLYGTHVTTRAYPDQGFRDGPGRWAGVTNVEYIKAADGSGGLRIRDVKNLSVPLAFPLRTDTKYEWTIGYATKGGSAYAFVGANLTNILQIVSEEDEPLLLTHLQLRRVMQNPFDSQFIFFIKQLARFDLGVSASQNLPVSQILKDGIGPTLCLTIPILLLEVAISVVLALLCAFYRGRWPDRAMVLASTVLMSVNYLVWIVSGQYFLGYKWGWFPVWGFASWSYLLLPVLIGVFSGLGAEVRFYRSIMLDEVYKDYVRTAFAKGVSKPGVLFRHVLPNALIPIITNVALSLPFLYTGSLLLESFFGIPGLGYLSVNAINDSDVDVVRAIVVVGSVLYLIFNLITDILYALVDPKVKFT